MGLYTKDAFVGRGESRWCWLNDMEFAEQAHVLKILARELGQDTAPAIAELAQHGLDAALGVIAGAAGNGVADAYREQRALWRAGRAQ